MSSTVLAQYQLDLVHLKLCFCWLVWSLGLLFGGHLLNDTHLPWSLELIILAFFWHMFAGAHQRRHLTLLTSVWQMTAEVIPIKYGLLYSLLRKLAEITAILRQTIW